MRKPVHMEIVARRSVVTPPRVYFIHIPKTAGVSVKAFLEDNYPAGAALVVDEWDAEAMPSEALNRYSLFSGHYSAGVLSRIDPPPALTVMLVREPVARFRSWLAHGRRLTVSRDRSIYAGRSDAEILRSPDTLKSRQAYYLARAVRDGANCAAVPSVAELPGLLDRVNLVGITEETERFTQLVAFHLGWPAPSAGWHINRRPDGAVAAAERSSLSDDAIRGALDEDVQLYDEVRRRFWTAYAAMLSAINPTGATFTDELAMALDVATARTWLAAHHARLLSEQFGRSVTGFVVDGAGPVSGEGWWWREMPGTKAYRWSGPGPAATVVGPALEPDHTYTATLDLMGAADFPTWRALTVEINGEPVTPVKERIMLPASGGVTLRLRASITPATVARQDGLTRVTVRVPEALRAMAHIIVEESFDTRNPDDRAVGVALQRLTVSQDDRPFAAVAPILPDAATRSGQAATA